MKLGAGEQHKHCGYLSAEATRCSMLDAIQTKSVGGRQCQPDYPEMSALQTKQERISACLAPGTHTLIEEGETIGQRGRWL